MIRANTQDTRREYNNFVADETLEDYSLRYAPKSFRKFSELLIVNTAVASVSALVLEVIGASIAISYGFETAFWAILTATIIIFLTAIPISYSAAKYNIDIDLITRSAGFGYIGSTVTSLIYASFSFIFFALEAAIMAQALELYFGLPLFFGYILSSLIIIPLVFYGITLINKIQLYSLPIWIVMMIVPFIAILLKEPEAINTFVNFKGVVSGSSEFDFYYFGFALGISLSLIAQIGEQVDYIRFMPEQTKENRVKWWIAVIASGPMWFVFSFFKQMAGIFLAGVVLLSGLSIYEAKTPIQMYFTGYQYICDNPEIALAITTFYVVVSQIKINVANAYAGSLAWSNFFSRVTHSHPGRVVWLVFNIAIALLLMELGVFGALEKVLGIYSNVAIAWISAISIDLIVNKPLGLSPKIVEFKRAYLYNINPVGVGSMGIASVVSIVAFMGYFGIWAQSYSAIIAMALTFILSPLIAFFTKGKYYIARENELDKSSQTHFICDVCNHEYEKEDMIDCPLQEEKICSLCCSLDSLCHDTCKAETKDRLKERISDKISKLFFSKISKKASLRLFNFTSTMFVLLFIIGVAAWMIQDSYTLNVTQDIKSTFQDAFYTLFIVIAIIIGVLIWWALLLQENRELVEIELDEKYNELLESRTKLVEQKRVLDDQKELYNLVFENSTNAVLLFDIGTEKILDCNEETSKILEYESKSEIIGKNPIEFSPEFQPDGTKSVDSVMGKIAECMKNGFSSFEWTHITKNGREFWVEITLTSLELMGKEIIHASWKDINDKKRAEEELESQNLVFAESQRLARIGSWRLDLITGILTWSEEIHRIFEVDKEIEPSYELFLNAIHPDDRDAVNSAYSDSLEDKKKYEIAHKLLMKDGRVKHVVEQCETTFDNSGKPLVSLGTVQDITVQKITESKLMENQVMLLQQARLASAGEMIGNISHQWRQPLNALGLLVQKLNIYYQRDILDDEKMNSSIEKSMELIKGMSTTIDDFRDFFNPTKEEEIFLVVDGLDKAYAIIEATIESNSIKYNLCIEDNSIEIFGYINEFSQVVVNLFNNAKDILIEKQIKEGYIRVDVKSNSDEVIVSVTDNGGGIKESVMAKIFEPYFTTKEQGKGTGIGLYMSKIIIEDHHNGALDVVNTDDGVSFNMKFPRVGS